MIVTTLWCNVGRTSLCESKNTTEEDWRWVTRVKSSNSILPGSRSRARTERRDAGFGHRSSLRASTARRENCASTVRRGNAGSDGPRPERHTIVTRPRGENIVNKNVNIPVKTNRRVSKNGVSLIYRCPLMSVCVWDDGAWCRNNCVTWHGWCGHVTAALHPVTRRDLSWHHLSQDESQMQIWLHLTPDGSI